MIFYVLEFIVILFLFLQLVIPVARGLPVFPIFREKKYEDEIKDLKQEQNVVDLKNQIENLKTKLKGK